MRVYVVALGAVTVVFEWRRSQAGPGVVDGRTSRVVRVLVVLQHLMAAYTQNREWVYNCKILEPDNAAVAFTAMPLCMVPNLS
jgi:hypothetical protein